MMLFPKGEYKAHACGEGAYITRAFFDSQGRRCTAYPATCSSVGTNNLEMAEKIAALMNANAEQQ